MLPPLPVRKATILPHVDIIEQWNLRKWALIAEILSAVAIVVSLGFVGYQLQQSNEQAALNTRALELAAYQQLIVRIRHTLNAKNQGKFDLPAHEEPSSCPVIARPYQIGKHHAILGNISPAAFEERTRGLYETVH